MSAIITFTYYHSSAETFFKIKYKKVNNSHYFPSLSVKIRFGSVYLTYYIFYQISCYPGVI